MSSPPPASDVRAARFTRLAELPLDSLGGSSSGYRGWSSLKEIWERRELLGMLTTRTQGTVQGQRARLPVEPRPPADAAAHLLRGGGPVPRRCAIDPRLRDLRVRGPHHLHALPEIVATGTGSIVANGGLVKKVYLPREIFPLASVGSSAFNFVIQLVILVHRGIVRGQHSPRLPPALRARCAACCILVYGTAFALLLSAVNVYLRDIQYLVEVVLLLAHVGVTHRVLAGPW